MILHFTHYVNMFIGNSSAIFDFLSLPGCHTKPALSVFVDLNILETSLFQNRFQLRILINRHAINDFCPLIVLVRVAAALVADEEGSVRFQDAPDLPEALRQVRPEVDWCCTIKVDIENSKSQYIEKDKQEATKDGSESTKI